MLIPPCFLFSPSPDPSPQGRGIKEAVVIYVLLFTFHLLTGMRQSSRFTLLEQGVATPCSVYFHLSPFTRHA
jgi:hypothetical protein